MELPLTLFWLDLYDVLMQHFVTESRAIDFAIVSMIKYFKRTVSLVYFRTHTVVCRRGLRGTEICVRVPAGG